MERMKASAWVERVEEAIEARKTVPHDQEVDANTAGRTEKSATESAQPQTSKNEEIIGNDDRIQDKIDTSAEMIEAIVSDSMSETCDDRPAHHMMTNEDRAQRRVCQDHFFGASNDNHEDAVHPKRDTKSEDNEIENDAVE